MVKPNWNPFCKILINSVVAARIVLPLNRFADLCLYNRSASSTTNASFAAAFVRPKQWMCSTPPAPSQPSPRNEDGHQKVKTQSCSRKTHLRHFMISLSLLFLTFSIVNSYLESFTSSPFFFWLMIFFGVRQKSSKAVIITACVICIVALICKNLKF